MTLAVHVRTLGRGPGRSRALTQGEAEEAMGLMLSPDAAPEAVGALLMLLRMKGETAEEIAGFAEAAQGALPDLPAADLDWPSYSAGRSRGLPWFLLSARLVAAAGYRVMLHGSNNTDKAVRDHLAAAGIPRAPADPSPIGYWPLEKIHPALFRLLSLRSVLGLRSCINTVARMLNPGRAPASVQGVFHPSYRALQADAARLMGWRALSIIKGGGGEFERHPSKIVSAFGLRGGAAVETTFPAHLREAVRLSDGPRPGTTIAGLWSGNQHDAFAEPLVVGTAALALDTLCHDTPERTARRLWDTRASLERTAV